MNLSTKAKSMKAKDAAGVRAVVVAEADER